MRHALFAITFGLLATATSSGGAQGPPEPSGRAQPAFATLADSQWVRVSGTGLERREGRLVGRSASEIVLSAQPQPLRVRGTTVDSLWTRGTSFKTGALVGALLGAALGTGLGVACGETTDDCNTASAVVLFGGLGLGGGGLLGGLIGASQSKWHRRYP